MGRSERKMTTERFLETDTDDEVES